MFYKIKQLHSIFLALIVSLFLLFVFFLATPYDLLHTTKARKTVDELVKDTEEGSISRRVGLFSLGVFSIFNLIRRRQRRAKDICLLRWIIILLLVWAILSIIWTDDKAMTFRKLMILTILCLGAFVFAQRFSLHDIILIGFFISGFTLLIALGAEIALDAFHPSETDYRFAGIMKPNNQAWNCAVLIIAALSLLRMAQSGHICYYITAFVAFAFILLTRSRATAASICIAITYYWLLTTPRRSKSTIISLSALVIPALYLILYFATGEELLFRGENAVLLGRSSSNIETLTGRIPMWQQFLCYLAPCPIGGYGYHSFWTPSHIWEISLTQDWTICSPHSGYFDIALGLGTVGLIAYVLILVLAIKRSIKLFKLSGNIGYAFCSTLLIWLCLNMLTEAILLYPNIPSFLCMIILAKLAFTHNPELV